MGQEKPQGHYLNNRGNTPDATLSFKAIVELVLEKKICKVFTIYGRDIHVDHVTPF